MLFPVVVDVVLGNKYSVTKLSMVNFFKKISFGDSGLVFPSSSLQICKRRPHKFLKSKTNINIVRYPLPPCKPIMKLTRSRCFLNLPSAYLLRPQWLPAGDSTQLVLNYPHLTITLRDPEAIFHSTHWGKALSTSTGVSCLLDPLLRSVSRSGRRRRTRLKRVCQRCGGGFVALGWTLRQGEYTVHKIDRTKIHIEQTDASCNDRRWIASFFSQSLVCSWSLEGLKLWSTRKKQIFNPQTIPIICYTKPVRTISLECFQENLFQGTVKLAIQCLNTAEY